MNIKTGTTRIVFIFENFVIKIPLIPIGYFFLSLLKHLARGSVQQKIDDLGINHTFLFKFFLAGFRANCIEWQYSRQNPSHEDIIPVHSMFYGLIIVQPKGHNFLTSGKRWKRKLKKLVLSGVTDHDMLVPHNYSSFKGKIRLHDYGSSLTVSCL